MKVFFILIFINIFYQNVTTYSIFVKISWRESGENNQEYYKNLTNKQTERFEFELSGNSLKYPINEVTDVFDTVHFFDEEIYGEDFTLEITMFNTIIATIYEVENNAIIYIFPRENDTKYIKLKNDENNQHFNTMINLIKTVRVFLFTWVPITSDESIIKIGCKDDKNSPFLTSLNDVANDEENKYQSSNYIKTKLCSDNEYILLIEEEIVPTSKTGREIIKHNGFFFVLDKPIKEGKSWRCMQRKCKTRLHTDLENNLPEQIENHDHDPPVIKKRFQINELKCDPPIYSNNDNIINSYLIYFDGQFHCELNETENTMAGNYLYMLENNEIQINEQIKEIFNENSNRLSTPIYTDWTPKINYKRQNRSKEAGTSSKRKGKKKTKK